MKSGYHYYSKLPCCYEQTMQLWLQDKNEIFSVEDVTFCLHLLEREMQNESNWTFFAIMDYMAC